MHLVVTFSMKEKRFNNIDVNWRNKKESFPVYKVVFHLVSAKVGFLYIQFLMQVKWKEEECSPEMLGERWWSGSKDLFLTSRDLSFFLSFKLLYTNQ